MEEAAYYTVSQMFSSVVSISLKVNLSCSSQHFRKRSEWLKRSGKSLNVEGEAERACNKYEDPREFLNIMIDVTKGSES